MVKMMTSHTIMIGNQDASISASCDTSPSVVIDGDGSVQHAGISHASPGWGIA